MVAVRGYDVMVIVVDWRLKKRNWKYEARAWIKLNKLADKKYEFILKVFDSNDYDKWKFRLMLFLEMKNCSELYQMKQGRLK